MEQTKLQKIIEIKVDVNKAIKGITSLNAKIAEQKQRQKELKEEIKKLTEAQGDHTDEIEHLQEAYVRSQQQVKDYNNQIQGLSKTIQNQLRVDREQLGSLTQLRAQLSNLTKAYDEMGKEEREAAAGQELKQKIKDVTEAIKQEEEATERYYRNVGNYENAIRSTIGLNSQFAQTLQNIAEVTRQGVTEALKTAAMAVKNVMKQMLALLANPIVAMFAAIASVLMTISSGIRSSEENTARWHKAMSSFKPLMDVVTKACQAFAGVVLNIIEKVGKATGMVMKFLERLPLIGDNIAAINAETERYNRLEEAKYQLDLRSRDLELESAKIARNVAELRTKAKDKERYTDEERLSFVQKANELEREIADQRKAMAEERLRILQEEAKATENTKEINDELKRAEADVYRAEQDYNVKIRELLEQENTIRNEILSEERARAAEQKRKDDEKIERQKKLNEALEEAYKETQDMMIELLQEGFVKQEELERTRYEREVQAIKDKQALYMEDKALYEEYALQLELAAQKHVENMQQIAIDQRKREADERALEWENRILEAEKNGENYKALTLEMLRDQIDEMYQLQGESDAAFYNRRIKAQQAYLEEKKKQDEDEVAMERAKISAIGSILGSLSSILEATAGDNKKRLKAAKIAALGEVALNQGIAIAQAVSSVKGIPFPGNVPAIAISVANAIASLVPAIQAVNSVKLARGGYVRGAGTSTSDSIPAMLSNGEYVVNAKATSMFPELLETINSLGLGIASPARSEMVNKTRKESNQQQALMEAIQKMPAPVVSVKEVMKVEDRLRALENLSKV